ncbi:MAG: hypothetical protein RIS94_3274, partial [Pseudomonadota bacterium]
ETAEDLLITRLIMAAQRMVERRTGLSLISCTWRQALDLFPARASGWRGRILLMRGPVTAVSALSYLDAAGTVQTLASNAYVLDKSAPPSPARLSPAWATAWPIARRQDGAITIDFTAGYANAAAVPADLLLAVQLLVAHWYENREAVQPGTMSAQMRLSFDELTEDYRIRSFG